MTRQSTYSAIDVPKQSIHHSNSIVVNNLRAVSRQRGSIMLLVVVVIVLMAVIGASFMQAARVQSMGTKTYEGDMEQVQAAVLGQIGQVLLDDLFDQNGDMFNQADSIDTLGDASAINDIVTGADEPNDYAWTNNSVTDRPITMFLNGSTQRASGGRFDDPWLASTMPDFTSGTWPQITNVSGAVVVENTNQTTDLGSSSNTNGWRQKHSINGGFLWDRNVNIPITNTDSFLGSTSPNLVDADNDGLGDSRWEMAALPQVGNVRYVFAARIIDLSAMVNVDVATGQIDNFGAYDTFTNAPRWDKPTELDLGLLMAQAIFPGGTTWDSDLQAALKYRGNGNTAGPTISPLLPRSSRESLWEDQVRRYGSLDSGVGATVNGRADFNYEDEWELRGLNGLGDGIQTGQLETVMPDILEIAVADPVLASFAAVENHYDNNGSSTTANPQLYMTVSSGVGVFAPRISSDGNIVYKTDINQANGDEIRDLVEDIMSSPTVTTLPGGYTDAADYAAAFAAALIDYRDADNLITVQTATNGNQFFGMERFPAIAETYVQHRYEASVTNSGDLDLEGDNPDYEIEWTSQGAAGFCIEIRNPWNREVDLRGVRLYINGTEIGELASLVTPVNLPTHPFLPTDEAIVFHRDSNGGSSPSNDEIADSVNAIYTPDGVTARYVDLSGLSISWPDNGAATISAGGTSAEGALTTGEMFYVTISLGADSTLGTTVQYQYAMGPTLPDSFEQRIMDQAASPDGSTGYGAAKMNVVSNLGVNMLLVPEADATPGINSWLDSLTQMDAPDFSNGVGNDDRDVTATALGAESKVPGASPSTVFNDTTAEQWIIGDDPDDQIRHLGEVALISVLAPQRPSGTGPYSVPADIWVSQQPANPNIDSYRLDLSLSATEVYGTGNEYVRHATLLLERMTTYSPRNDGIDNDGDGIVDEADENFIPGKINLNTASELVLRTVLPIADQNIREQVATSIVNYRTNLARPTNSRSVVGIAHIGELFPVLRDAFTTNTFSPPAPSYIGDTDEVGPPSSVELDFLADPAGANPNQGSDGVADDREEELMLTSWLYQVASTRSDTYAAYILIKGYPADDPSLGAVETRRLIVIFNRGGVENSSSEVPYAVLRVE